MASTLTGVLSVMAQLDRLVDNGQKSLAQAVTRAAALTATDAKANASGRPGPNAPSGAFRTSITHVPATSSGSSTVAFVGSNAAQAGRLEFGFYNMTDSPGRTFKQPAYPWLAPTIPKAAQHLRDEVQKGVRWRPATVSNRRTSTTRPRRSSCNAGAGAAT